ncbi:MAG: DUF502 domain-containing protein [Planctomycetota bacterium]|nr:DUF502 domain-containing protein [Planctomycetota bacterium]
MKNASTPSPARKHGPFRLGLIAILPSIITVIILVAVFGFVYRRIAMPVGYGVIDLADAIGGDTLDEFLQDHLIVSLGCLRQKEYFVAVVGFPFAVFTILVVGALASVALRGSMLLWFGRLLGSLPIVRTVYPFMKQFADYLLGTDEKLRIAECVAAEYPCKGTYSVGYVTGEGLKTVNEVGGEKTITVFISASPIPATGFAYFVPEKEAIKLNASAEELFLFAFTGGILTPLGERQKGKEPDS